MAKYVIKKGDTLSAISRATGVSVANLAKSNNISNPNKIYAGASISIPAVSAARQILSSPVNRPAVSSTSYAPTQSVSSYSTSPNHPVIQSFNNYNPSVERFSPGGKNIGVDLQANIGSDLYAPNGRWKVVDVFNGSKGRPHIGNKENNGYGNSVKLQNLDTGELLRMSHLQRAYTPLGQEVQGGQLIAKSGWTGNASEPHVDVEYYNHQGQLADATKTPYATQIFGPTPQAQPAVQPEQKPQTYSSEIGVQ